MVGNNSAVDNFADDIGVVNSGSFQLDISVINKYSSAYRNVLCCGNVIEQIVSSPSTSLVVSVNVSPSLIVTGL